VHWINEFSFLKDVESTIIVKVRLVINNGNVLQQVRLVTDAFILTF
jgi:hypothetical protein